MGIKISEAAYGIDGGLCIFSKNSIFDLELCDAHGSGIVRAWDVMVSQAFFNGGNFRNRPVVIPEQDQHVRTAVVDGVRTYLHRFYNGLLYLVLAGIQPPPQVADGYVLAVFSDLLIDPGQDLSVQYFPFSYHVFECA